MSEDMMGLLIIIGILAYVIGYINGGCNATKVWNKKIGE